MHSSSNIFDRNSLSGSIQPSFGSIEQCYTGRCNSRGWWHVISHWAFRGLIDNTYPKSWGPWPRVSWTPQASARRVLQQWFLQSLVLLGIQLVCVHRWRMEDRCWFSDSTYIYTAVLKSIVLRPTCDKKKVKTAIHTWCALGPAIPRRRGKIEMLRCRTHFFRFGLSSAQVAPRFWNAQIFSPKITLVFRRRRFFFTGFGFFTIYLVWGIFRRNVVSGSFLPPPNSKSTAMNTYSRLLIFSGDHS